MVDFGSNRPERPLYDLLNKVFRPGDIFTHVYGGNRGEHDLKTLGPSQALVDGRYDDAPGLFVHPVQDDAVMAGNGTIEAGKRAELISVALRGAARAVDANLSRFEDEQYVTRTTEQCRQLEADGTETMKGILRALDAV